MSQKKLLFTRKQRITKKSEFDCIYKNAIKITSGPFLIHRVRNESTFSRLGLSIPKRVGNAVKRNAIRRRCREAFRITQHELPNQYDIVITIRPHSIQEVTQYITLLRESLT